MLLCLYIIYVTDNFSIQLGYFDLCKDLLNVNKNSNSNEHYQHYHHHYRSFIHVVALLSHPQGIFVCHGRHCYLFVNRILIHI